MRVAIWCLVVVLFATICVAKKKETAAPITEVMPYIGCDVCSAMVKSAMALRDEVRRNATESGKKLTEDRLLEEVVEPLCNPHLDQGDYLRRLDWTTSGNTVEFTERDEFGKCKRKCWTAAEVCLAITSGDGSDTLSGLLYRDAPYKKLHSSVCADACRRQKAALAKAEKEAGRVKASWGAEAFEVIDDKEKEIEAMMERMAIGPNGGQGADVFTRDEMGDIRAAMDEGDLERLQELDPSYSDLDEESFDALRQMEGAAPAKQQKKKSKKASTKPASDPSRGESHAAGNLAKSMQSFLDAISAWFTSIWE